MATPLPPAMAMMCQTGQSGWSCAQMPSPSLLGNVWNPLETSPLNLSHHPSFSEDTSSPGLPQPSPWMAQITQSAQAKVEARTS